MARKLSDLEEAYPLERSPLCQKLTHHKLAKLLGIKASKLKGLVKYRESFIVRQRKEVGGKVRLLCYPEGELKLCNKAIARLLNRIILPSYYMSPRVRRSIYDNAELHSKGHVVYKLDVRQFYPSVTRNQVFQFFKVRCGIYPDVARTLTELLTADGTVFFGGNATPRLVALMFAPMFDEIDEIVRSHGGEFSVWVDNMIASSDDRIPGLLDEMFATLNRYGFRGHQASVQDSKKKHLITGVKVYENNTYPKNAVELRIKRLEEEIHQVKDLDRWERISLNLLSSYGVAARALSDSKNRKSKIASRMGDLRLKRRRLREGTITL